jgi:prepilin-type N-terminal cleavage/methylation domain-containing protein/prepilin-type processing-associated H-X9-DG protein
VKGPDRLSFVRFTRRSTFTLIELLVVIAIIAILAALLMPTLRRAMESAKSVKCVSNQHQLYLGISLYGHDRGVYPFGYESPSISDLSYRLNPYLGRGTGDTRNAGGESRSPCIICPSHGWKYTVDTNKMHYSINAQLAGRYQQGGAMNGNLTPVHPRKYPYDSRTTEIILFADGGQGASAGSDITLWAMAGWDSAYSAATAETVIPAYEDSDVNVLSAGVVTFRHKSREAANVCFVDGHIEALKRNQLKQKHVRLNAPVYTFDSWSP